MKRIRESVSINRARFLAAVLGSSPGVLFVYTPLVIMLTLMGVAIPFATGRLIDALAYHHSPSVPFVCLAVFLLCRALLMPTMQRFVNRRSRNIETDLQFRVLSATMGLQPSILSTLENGKFVGKLTRDVYAIGGFVRGLYPKFLQAVVMTVAAGGALLDRSMELAVLFVASMPLIIAGFVPFAHRFSEISHCVRTRSDNSFGALFNFLLTLPYLRILGSENRFADAPKEAFKTLKDGNDATDSLAVRFGFLLGLILVLGEIIVLGVAGGLAAQGSIPVGDVVLYQMLVLAAIQAVQGVICLLPELAALHEGVDSISEVFKRLSLEDGRVRIEAVKSISFNHVTFAYQGDLPRVVIKDYSAVFRSSIVVGLVGANGTGKTTFLKLAVKALDPQSGEICVNGYPFAEIDLRAFRRRIGVVFQDCPIIDASIRDNITLRDPTCTQQDVARALELSGLNAVIKRFPSGLDTHIGRSGQNISGGECQRLAIARAIARNPFIIVFDEPMNHLDAESRRRFADILVQLRPGRLILLADHEGGLETYCDELISAESLNKGL